MSAILLLRNTQKGFTPKFNVPQSNYDRLQAKGHLH